MRKPFYASVAVWRVFLGGWIVFALVDIAGALSGQMHDVGALNGSLFMCALGVANAVIFIDITKRLNKTK
jgi:hypothetical protein